MRNVALVIVFLLGVVPASGAEASAPAKSFDSALDEIVKRSTQVDIQKSRLTAADSLLLSSRLNFLPRLSLEATQTRAGEPASETKEIAGVATLNLFRFGSDWAAMRAAESNRDMEASRLASAALEAEQAGANALITLIETRLKLEVLKRRVQATESFLNIAQVRYRKGLAPLEEVDRIEIDLSNERAQLDDMLKQLRTAEADVVRYLGHSDIETAWPWKPAMRSAKTKELAARKPGLEGRPDFEAARLASSAEAARATRAHRALFPSLNLSYSQGQIETGGQWESEWRTSLVLSIPLFSGWEDVAAYRAQSETARQAELTLEQLRRDGLSYQRAHQENFKIGLQTAENRERVLVTSQRLLKKNLLRSQAGRASANDLLVERGREAQAELVAVEGWARAHAALVQLYHAFGQSVRGL